jgi:hypothetical protein
MPLLSPVSAAWNTVARFSDYESAQRAVDRLSDDGFPVEKLDIAGSGLRLVERVTGRLARGRAAAAGALSGTWAGLLFGILLGLFTSGNSFLAVAATGAVRDRRDPRLDSPVAGGQSIAVTPETPSGKDPDNDEGTRRRRPVHDSVERA